MGKSAAGGSKHPHEKTLLDSGLSSREPIDSSPGASGMDNKGKDMKPMPTPRKSVTGKGKDFTIC